MADSGGTEKNKKKNMDQNKLVLNIFFIYICILSGILLFFVSIISIIFDLDINPIYIIFPLIWGTLFIVLAISSFLVNIKSISISEEKIARIIYLTFAVSGIIAVIILRITK